MLELRDFFAGDSSTPMASAALESGGGGAMKVATLPGGLVWWGVVAREGGGGGTVLEELDLLGEPDEMLLLELEILSIAPLMSVTPNCRDTGEWNKQGGSVLLGEEQKMREAATQEGQKGQGGIQGGLRPLLPPG